MSVEVKKRKVFATSLIKTMVPTDPQPAACIPSISAHPSACFRISLPVHSLTATTTKASDMAVKVKERKVFATSLIQTMVPTDPQPAMCIPSISLNPSAPFCVSLPVQALTATTTKASEKTVALKKPEKTVALKKPEKTVALKKDVKKMNKDTAWKNNCPKIRKYMEWMPLTKDDVILFNAEFAEQRRKGGSQNDDLALCLLCNKIFESKHIHVHVSRDHYDELKRRDMEGNLRKLKCLICSQMIKETISNAHSRECTIIDVQSVQEPLPASEFDKVFPFDKDKKMIKCPHCPNWFTIANNLHVHLVIFHKCLWRRTFSDQHAFDTWFGEMTFTKSLVKKTQHAFKKPGKRGHHYTYYCCREHYKGSCPVVLKKIDKWNGMEVTYNDSHCGETCLLPGRVALDPEVRKLMTETVHAGLSNEEIFQAVTTRFDSSLLRYFSVKVVESHRSMLERKHERNLLKAVEPKDTDFNPPPLHETPVDIKDNSHLKNLPWKSDGLKIRRNVEWRPLDKDDEILADIGFKKPFPVGSSTSNSLNNSESSAANGEPHAALCLLCNKIFKRNDILIHIAKCHKDEVGLEEGATGRLFKCLICSEMVRESIKTAHEFRCSVINVDERPERVSPSDFDHVFPFDTNTEMFVCPRCPNWFTMINDFHEHLVLSHQCFWKRKFPDKAAFDAWYRSARFTRSLMKKKEWQSKRTNYTIIYLSCREHRKEADSCPSVLKRTEKANEIEVIYIDVHNHDERQDFRNKLSPELRKFINISINAGLSNEEVVTAARAQFEPWLLDNFHKRVVQIYRYKRLKRDVTTSVVDLDLLAEEAEKPVATRSSEVNPGSSSRTGVSKVFREGHFSYLEQQPDRNYMYLPLREFIKSAIDDGLTNQQIVNAARSRFDHEDAQTLTTKVVYRYRYERYGRKGIVQKPKRPALENYEPLPKRSRPSVKSDRRRTPLNNEALRRFVRSSIASGLTDKEVIAGGRSRFSFEERKGLTQKFVSRLRDEYTSRLNEFEPSHSFTDFGQVATSHSIPPDHETVNEDFETVEVSARDIPRQHDVEMYDRYSDDSTVEMYNEVRNDEVASSSQAFDNESILSYERYSARQTVRNEIVPNLMRALEDPNIPDYEWRRVGEQLNGILQRIV